MALERYRNTPFGTVEDDNGELVKLSDVTQMLNEISEMDTDMSPREAVLACIFNNVGKTA